MQVRKVVVEFNLESDNGRVILEKKIEDFIRDKLGGTHVEARVY